MLGDISQFVPGLGVASIIGLVAGPALGHFLGVGRLLGAATTISIGVILVTTLAPGGDVPVASTAAGVCDLTRVGPGTLADLLTVNEISLNIMLFVPLGLTLGIMRRSRRMAVAIAAATALPFAIEWLQLLVPSLGRYCDSADIADNLTGLAIGLVIGTILGVAGRRGSRPGGAH